MVNLIGSFNLLLETLLTEHIPSTSLLGCQLRGEAGQILCLSD